MEKEQNKRFSLRPAVAWAAAAVAASCLIACVRGVLSSESIKEAAGILSDSFLIPGVMLSGAGALGYAASKGAYDAFGFVFSRFSLHSLVPSWREEAKPETLYEYRKKKEENGRAWKPTVLLSGLMALALSAVFLAVYTLAG